MKKSLSAITRPTCPSWSVEPELTGLSYHARAGGDQRRDEVRDRLEAVHEASLTLGEETLEKTRAILPEDIRARRRSSHPGSINQATGRKRSSGQGCQGSTVDVRHVPGLSAQQRRSNSALRTHMKHHAPALLLWCNALLREGSWWALWWGSLDGMQGVRGSNPLSSTRHNASAALPLRAVCQQIVSRSLHVSARAL
jgi:hypothetical protein